MTSKEKLQQIYAKVEALKLSVERLSSEDETKDKPVEKKRAKYKGLALCHNETQTPLSEIFPSLPKNIEWTYVDLDNAGNNLIIANIYQTELFEKLTKQKASYDYIVMPFCIVYPPTRFNCVFPLLSMAPFLKSGGKLINTNFYIFFIRALAAELDSELGELTYKALSADKSLSERINKEICTVVLACGYKSYQLEYDGDGGYNITITK